jgi:hypothetical protein
MSTSFDASGFEISAFDRGTDPILHMIPVEQARQIAQYQGDEQLRGRIDDLAAKCNEGTLTPAEQSEYEGYVHANKFVAILQAQARKLLAARPRE